MEKEFEELKKLAEPLQEWLTSNFNPMCSIVVEMDRVTIISREMSTVLETKAKCYNNSDNPMTKEEYKDYCKNSKNHGI